MVLKIRKKSKRKKKKKKKKNKKKQTKIIIKGKLVWGNSNNIKEVIKPLEKF